MSTSNLKYFAVVIFGVTFFYSPVWAAQKNTNVSIDVYFCNHDTICDDSLGENYTYCSDDCPPPICNNNGICDNSEDINNCAADCTPTTTPPNNGGGGGGGGGSSAAITSSTTINTSTTASTSTTSTPEIPTSTILANPFFSAFGQDSKIYLSWKKTNNSDLWSEVVIRRSTLFYPENISAGGLLYDGLGKTTDNINFYLYDTGLQNGKRFFYTIFVVDKNGNVSSGVTASALTVAKTTPSSSLEIPKTDLPPETTLPKSPNFQEINFDNLVFSTSSPSSTMLEIPADKVPSSTFTAIATLQDEVGFQSYILGVGPNGMFTNFPSVFSAEKQLTVTFLDRNHQIISQINGKIGGMPKESEPTTTFFQKLLPVLTDWRVILTGILGLILFFIRLL